jgi:hypothetical protein
LLCLEAAVLNTIFGEWALERQNNEQKVYWARRDLQERV